MEDNLDISLEETYEEAQAGSALERLLRNVEADNSSETGNQPPKEKPTPPIMDDGLDPDVLERINEKEASNPIRKLDEFKTKQTYGGQALVGSAEAFEGFFNALDSAGDALNIPDPRIQFLDKDGKFIKPRIVSGEEQERLTKEGVPSLENMQFDEADSTGKAAVREVSKFLTGFLAFRGMFGAVGKGGQVAKDTAAAFATGTVVADPDQEGFAELLEDVPMVKNAIGPLLNNEDDNEFVKRLKNGLEEMGAGALFDTLVKGVKQGAKFLVKDSPDALKAFDDDLLQNSLDGVGDLAEDAPVMGSAIDFSKGADVSPDDLIGKGFVQVESGGDDVYINFARINEPDEVKGLIDNLAQAESKGIKKAQRGKQSFKETEALADDLGLTPEQLMKRQKGTGFESAEHAVASRKLLAGSGKNLLALSKLAARGDVTPQQLFAFRRAVAVHKAVQQQVLGAQAESARTLASFRIPVDGADSLSAIQAVLDNAGGDAVSKKLAQSLQALEASGASAAQINAFAKKGWQAATADAVSESFVTGLLWTPSTHMVNFIGNTMAIGFDVANKRMAEAINAFTGNKGGVVAGEAMASLHGLKMGFKDALIHSARSTKIGAKLTDTAADITGKNLGKGIDSEIGGIGRLASESGSASRAISADAFGVAPGPLATGIDMIGTAIRLPGEALTMNDEFFKSIGYRMQLHSLAWRNATNEGLERTSKEFAERVDELVKNPTKEIKLEATDAVLYNTFQNKTGKFGEGIVKVRGAAGPAGTWFLPFARTPINLFRYSIEHSPLAPVPGLMGMQTQWAADIAAGGARKQIAMAKMMNGTLLAGFAVDAVQAGYITGGGAPYKDKAERQAVRRQNLADNSLVVGNKSLPINKLDPVVATTFSIAADIYDLSVRYDFPEDNELTSIISAFGMALGRSITNKTYLKSIGELADAMTSESRFESVRAQITASSIPFATALRTIERMEDPTLRETMGYFDEIKAALPVLSSGLIAKQNLWGEDRVETGGGAAPFLPMNPKTIKDSVADREIFRHNVPTLEIGWKGVSFDGTKVDFNEFPNVLHEYRRLAGNGVKDFNGDGLKEKLTKVMTNNHYESSIYNMRSDGMDGGKSQYIQGQISAFRKLAQNEILTNPKYNTEEYEEFRRHLIKTKADKPKAYNF